MRMNFKENEKKIPNFLQYERGVSEMEEFL